MIFLCFSVKDRVPLINDFFHFISNFGLDVWYDRRNIYLGDQREEINIAQGAANDEVKYAIIFYSENFRNGNICLDEYRILVERYRKQDVYLFPVFISKVPEVIDDRFKICKELVFKQISDQGDFMALSLHIISKITSDELCTVRYRSIKDVYFDFTEKSSVCYTLLLEYQNIENTNYNMRMAFLFAIFLVLSHNRKTNYFHYKTMHYIYHQNCLNSLIDEKRELQIMENIIVYEFSLL